MGRRRFRTGIWHKSCGPFHQQTLTLLQHMHDHERHLLRDEREADLRKKALPGLAFSMLLETLLAHDIFPHRLCLGLVPHKILVKRSRKLKIPLVFLPTVVAWMNIQPQRRVQKESYGKFGQPLSLGALDHGLHVLHVCHRSARPRRTAGPQHDLLASLLYCVKSFSRGLLSLGTELAIHFIKTRAIIGRLYVVCWCL